jgi:hypothetical protein
VPVRMIDSRVWKCGSAAERSPANAPGHRRERGPPHRLDLSRVEPQVTLHRVAHMSARTSERRDARTPSRSPGPHRRPRKGQDQLSRDLGRPTLDRTFIRLSLRVAPVALNTMDLLQATSFDSVDAFSYSSRMSLEESKNAMVAF